VPLTNTDPLDIPRFVRISTASWMNPLTEVIRFLEQKEKRRAQTRAYYLKSQERLKRFRKKRRESGLHPAQR
jgi:hypothetical protein